MAFLLKKNFAMLRVLSGAQCFSVTNDFFPGLKNTYLYCLNGALMTLIFFCCRVLVFPILYDMYARQIGKFQSKVLSQP